VAAERERIARELHDVIAHSVSVMVVQAGAGERVLDGDPEQARAAFYSIRETGSEALEEMRRLLGLLRQKHDALSLAPQPSIARLSLLVDEVRAAGLPTQLAVEGRPKTLAPGIELSAYRIVQEALTNIRKHAGAVSASVRVHYTEHEVVLEVDDNGNGTLETNGDGSGHGLIGMRERAALYGGTLEAGPRTDGGFRIRATLPLEHPSP
jgi:signal transduction histidine kinase